MCAGELLVDEGWAGTHTHLLGACDNGPIIRVDVLVVVAFRAVRVGLFLGGVVLGLAVLGGGVDGSFGQDHRLRHSSFLANC